MLAAFLLAFAGSSWVHAGAVVHDTDSAYHLAIARAYWQEGVIAELPLRLSLLGEDLSGGFGDKEFLFHALLAPLMALDDPMAAGRLGLALGAALVAALVAGLAWRAVGAWACLLPTWLFFASTEFAWRLVRLRPETLSLALILAAVWAIGGGRARLLGLIAFTYTLGYTAFHAFLGLVGLLFLYLGWSRRRWEWRLLLYPVLGAALALLVHPHFPKNLEVWVAQSFHFFRLKGVLDVGSEIRPNFTDVSLMVHLGWLLAMVALWRSAEPGGGEVSESDRRTAEALAIAAACFGGLYLLMSRFSIYFFPLLTLWLFFELRRRGLRVGRWVRLPGRGRLPLAAALAVSLLLSLPEAGRQLAAYRQRTDPGPGGARLEDRRAFAAAVPAGAKVAAPWGATALYLLIAPQGRYLNVLDPVFMALPYPQAYGQLRRILEGTEPDVPWAALRAFDSDFLAFATPRGGELLTARLKADPRVELRHRGAHTLVRFRPAAGFERDWRVVPPGSELPPRPEADLAAWPAYPRDPDPAGARLEGYVDADRVSAEAACVAFVRGVETAAPEPLELELAASGPTTLWLDDRLLVEDRAGVEAVLGRGAGISVELEAGHHLFTVLTCRGGNGAGRKGFYWLDRRPGSLAGSGIDAPNPVRLQ